LADVEPLNLPPTWKNLRTREEKMAKRLNIFLVSKLIMVKIVKNVKKFKIVISKWDFDKRCKEDQAFISPEKDNFISFIVRF
jgi:hypothetical protein